MANQPAEPQQSWQRSSLQQRHNIHLPSFSLTGPTLSLQFPIMHWAAGRGQVNSVRRCHLPGSDSAVVVVFCLAVRKIVAVRCTTVCLWLKQNQTRMWKLSCIPTIVKVYDCTMYPVHGGQLPLANHWGCVQTVPNMNAIMQNSHSTVQSSQIPQVSQFILPVMKDK